MDSLQGLKSRSRAVRSVGQITKAMEVVAATKMRRAQEMALRTRPYAFEALALLAKILRDESFTSPFAQKRAVLRTLLVLVASDKGLTGSFNAQVFRAADRLLASRAGTYRAVVVGNKSIAYAEKKNLPIVKKFSGFGEYAKSDEIRPLVDCIADEFISKQADEVIVVSTHFRSALKQETVVRYILPVDFEKIRETAREIVPEHGRYADLRAGKEMMPNGKEYLFEPSRAAVFERLVPHLVAMQMYHLILEANASEHSARRVAMKTASDNAEELIGSLALSYNKARQESITRELVEITSTQEALS